MEELSVNYKADEIEIGFNSRYLQDITQQISGPSARFTLADAASPTLVQEVGDESVLYVLMPMRVWEIKFSGEIFVDMVSTRSRAKSSQRI